MPGPNPKHNKRHLTKKRNANYQPQNPILGSFFPPNFGSQIGFWDGGGSTTEAEAFEGENPYYKESNDALDFDSIPEGQPGSELFQSELTLQLEEALSIQKKILRRELHHQLAQDLAKKLNDEFIHQNQKNRRPVKSVKIQPDWIQKFAPNASIAAINKIVVELQDSFDFMINCCKSCPVGCLHRLTNSEQSQVKKVNAGISEIDLLHSLQSLLLDTIQSKTLRDKSQIQTPSLPKPELKIKNPSKSVFQFKIMLRNYRPLVWRRIEINCAATFEELHEAIQEAFGWSGMHLHDFTFKNPQFFNKIQRIEGIPPTRGTEFDDGWEMEGDYKEDQAKLYEIFSLGVSRVLYTYDFGDNWEHNIILEAVLPKNKMEIYPRVVKSKGECPEEDSRCW
jgi:hypothetical protein